MQTTANNKKLKKKSISDNSTATKATSFKSDSNKVSLFLSFIA